MAGTAPRSIRFLRLDRTSDAVRKRLAVIDQVSGTQGWMIGTDIGEVLLTSMRPPFNIRMLDAVGDLVVRSTAGVAGIEPANEIEINFTQGNVLAQKIGRGWLMVFCDLQADLAIARMALSVTAAALSTDKSFQNGLKLTVGSIQPDSSSLNTIRG